jgi:hypothetical protein
MVQITFFQKSQHTEHVKVVKYSTDLEISRPYVCFGVTPDTDGTAYVLHYSIQTNNS